MVSLKLNLKRTVRRRRRVPPPTPPPPPPTSQVKYQDVLLQREAAGHMLGRMAVLRAAADPSAAAAAASGTLPPASRLSPLEVAHINETATALFESGQYEQYVRLMEQLGADGVIPQVGDGRKHLRCAGGFGVFACTGWGVTFKGPLPLEPSPLGHGGVAWRGVRLGPWDFLAGRVQCPGRPVCS